jgi:hypothetical protein
VEFTTSKKAALEALKSEIEFSHKDPQAAKNWHHDLTYVYLMPVGWRKPTQRNLLIASTKYQNSAYPRNKMDILAGYVIKEGKRINKTDLY